MGPLIGALPSIGWRSFFQIQDQRENSPYDNHDRDQQHHCLPGSQLLNVSGQRPLQHNLSAQVRLWAALFVCDVTAVTAFRGAYL